LIARLWIGERIALLFDAARWSDIWPDFGHQRKNREFLNI
jgi:hypothetical protein